MAKEGAIINTHQQLTAAFKAGLLTKKQAVAVSYAPEDRGRGGRSAHVAVWSPYFNTDSKAAWYDYGKKTWIVWGRATKAATIEEAKAWAKKITGVRKWAKNAQRDWVPAIVQEKFPIFRASGMRTWGYFASMPRWAEAQFPGTRSGSARMIVAAKSRAAAERAMGARSTAHAAVCETGNEEEIWIAMAEPGRVFVTSRDGQKNTGNRWLGKPVATVLYFTAAWCAPCRAFGPLVEKLAAEMKIGVVKIDVDDPPVEYKDAARRIRAVPVLEAPDGTRMHGAKNEAALREWFEAVLLAAKEST